jgi:mxaD protein
MKMILALIGAFFTTAALAHGPTPIKVNEAIVINADPKAVWSVASKFDGIAKWHPDVKAVTAKGGDAAGAERELTLKGGVLKEGLDEFDPAAFKMGYRLAEPNVDALPASSYFVTLTVKPAANGASEVAWYGRLYRGDTSNEPPENLNDEAARVAMSAFLRNGLEGLKKAIERK